MFKTPVEKFFSYLAYTRKNSLYKNAIIFKYNKTRDFIIKLYFHIQATPRDNILPVTHRAMCIYDENKYCKKNNKCEIKKNFHIYIYISRKQAHIPQTSSRRRRDSATMETEGCLSRKGV